MFCSFLKTQFSAHIKILRSDSRGKHVSNEFHSFLQHERIISQHSFPSTPRQNGIVERTNEHLLDVVHTLLLESFVPPKFLCKALSIIVHLINRLLSPTLHNVSPFYKLLGYSPSYSDLCTFGYVCVHLLVHERHKLINQSIKCDFLGYPLDQKGYICYNP